jgi:hypothetical protein
METDFELYHGNNAIKQGPGVMKNLLEKLKKDYENIPEKVLLTFVRIRTFIRMKYLDRKELNERLRKKRERKRRFLVALAKKKALARAKKQAAKARKTNLQNNKKEVQLVIDRKRARKNKKYY